MERIFVFNPPIAKTATAPWRAAWNETPIKTGDEVTVLSIIGGGDEPETDFTRMNPR